MIVEGSKGHYQGALPRNTYCNDYRGISHSHGKPKKQSDVRLRRNSLAAALMSRGLPVWIVNPYDEDASGSGYRAGYVAAEDATEPLFVPAAILPLSSAAL